MSLVARPTYASMTPIPLKEDQKYVEAIKEDIQWLGFEWDALYFASDYFHEMYERAKLLIRKGKAYVCDLSPDEIREYRGTPTEPGKDSPYRNRSVEGKPGSFRADEEGRVSRWEPSAQGED